MSAAPKAGASLYFRNATRRHPVDEEALQARAGALLHALGESSATLSLTLVGDRAIRRLNREHRGKDKATDVLSFPLYEPERKSRKKRADAPAERMLGDVVISVDTALRQARDYDATLDDELARLLVHGMLHLLGHDHEKKHERKRMQREERRLFETLALRWPYD